MRTDDLTPEQQAEAERLEAAILDACREDIAGLARMLASKPEREIFGDTEFDVRDRVHAIGAKAIRSALEGRQKKATSAARSPAPSAAKRPSSKGGSPGGS